MFEPQVGVRVKPTGQSHSAGPTQAYEGALSFATAIRLTYIYSPYKIKRGRANDRRPSSKLAPPFSHSAAQKNWSQVRPRLGFGRTFLSEKEVPNMLVVLV